MHDPGCHDVDPDPLRRVMYAIGAATAAKLTMKVSPSRTFRPGAMWVTAWIIPPQKPSAPAFSSVSAAT